MIDNLLLEACRKGDEESWRRLFKSLYPLAKWVARRQLHSMDEGIIEDIAQETMVAIVPKIVRAKDAEYIERLVRKITRNKCIDHLRRNKVQIEELSEEIEAPVAESVEQVVITALRSALKNLGESCKGIIRSRFFKEKSHREIAAEIGVEVNQVGIRISRCLVRLRVLLSAQHIQAEDLL